MSAALTPFGFCTRDIAGLVQRPFPNRSVDIGDGAFMSMPVPGIESHSMQAGSESATALGSGNNSFVLTRREGHLLEVVINRPEARNSIHPAVNDELVAAFDAYEADDNLWVAIITGAGTQAFSAGGDLKYAAAGNPPMALGPTGLAGLTHRIRTKPVIAAVNGFAMGGGMEICLACDIVVADEAAKFGLSEPRVGLCALAGGPQRLVQQIPKKRAMELILTGQVMGAEEALSLGLINHLVPAGTALAGARDVAAHILECAPMAVRAAMRLVNDAAHHVSEAGGGPAHDLDLIAGLLESRDAREGLAAFVGKRKPVWSNR